MATVHIYSGDDLTTIINSGGEGNTYVLHGLHRAHTGYLKSNTTIEFDDAVLDGTVVLTGWLYDSSQGAYKVTGQTTNNGVVTRHTDDQSDIVIERPENLWVNGVRLRRVQSLGALVSGTWFFNYAGGIIWLKDNPADNLVERSVASRAFAKAGGSTGENIIIRNLRVRRYANHANSAAVALENMIGARLIGGTIYECHGAGFFMGEGSYVSHVESRFNGQYGGMARGVGGELLYSNLSDNNPYHEYSPGWATGGIKVSNANGLRIYRCDAHRNYGAGYWLDIDNGDLTKLRVTACNAFDNYTNGFFCEYGTRAVVAECRAIDNGIGGPGEFVGYAGIMVLDCQDCEIRNNYVHTYFKDATHYGHAITLGWDSRGTGTYQTLNNAVHNNEVVFGGSKGLFGGRVTSGNSTFYTSNKLNYNRLYQADANDLHYEWGPAGTQVAFDTYKAKSGMPDVNSNLMTALPTRADFRPVCAMQRYPSKRSSLGWTLCRR